LTGCVRVSRSPRLVSVNPHALAAKGPNQRTEREQAFLDHEVRTLCRMLDDHAIDEAHDLPPEVWRYLRAADKVIQVDDFEGPAAQKRPDLNPPAVPPSPPVPPPSAHRPERTTPPPVPAA